MAIADVSISGVCFMLPLGIALQARQVVLFGGHVPGRFLAGEELRPWLGNYHSLEPDPFCFCNDKGHRECNKALDLDLVVETVRRAARI